MANEQDYFFKNIANIEASLLKIQDTDILLENILSEARKIADADAGSIYTLESGRLLIKYAQNETLQNRLGKGKKLPFESYSVAVSDKSIAGFTALKSACLNIKDVYNLPPESLFAFNSFNDKKTGYKTVSMISVPLVSQLDKVIGVVQIINARNSDGSIVVFDDKAFEAIQLFAKKAVNAVERSLLIKSMVMRMQTMAMFHDPVETYPHVHRVSLYSLEIYDEWSLKHQISENERDSFRDELKIASCCHDFGKIGIEDSILKKVKPRLTERERSIMMGHTIVGALLFKEPVSSLDIMIRDVCLHHHEWWDGSKNGYPGKYDINTFVTGECINVTEPLMGDEIPFAARIVAIADVFDALSHKRIYKEAWSIDESINMVKKLSGTQFDPELVDAFLTIKDRIIAIDKAIPNSLD